VAGNDKTKDAYRASPGPWPDEPTLSVQRAFVVHFATVAGRRPGGFSGRVEHLPSGKAAAFTSLAELLAFFAAIVDRDAGLA
jgi:hypothetical protein